MKKALVVCLGFEPMRPRDNGWKAQMNLPSQGSPLNDLAWFIIYLTRIWFVFVRGCATVGGVAGSDPIAFKIIDIHLLNHFFDILCSSTGWRLMRGEVVIANPGNGH